ncbi:MAG: hypothetical protein DHS20C16_01940 [Phycisphaerae bacterium]|nr:MAG: hypothetical protein DHS20C16_01940 [Phycisphaerae bacterium]
MPKYLGRGYEFLCAFGAATVCLFCVSTAQAQVEWRSGVAPKSGLDKAAVIDRLASDGLRGAPVRQVVQFDQPITPKQRADLLDAGVTLQGYLGSDAYFAVTSAGGDDKVSLAAIDSLIDAQPIQLAWKLHPIFAEGKSPEWAIVPAPDGRSAAEDKWIGAYVVFHKDVDDDASRMICNRQGVVVRDRLESVNALVIELPLASVPVLAAEDGVMFIEPALPPFTMNNDSNRLITEASIAQAAPYSLDGSGVTVLVYDGGTARSTHQDFSGRLTVHDGSGLHYHPTHVAGTIGGDGTASGGTYTGMAPGTTLLSYGFEYDGSGTFLYSNPGDIESDYTEAINVHGADLSNNSIGTNVSQNGFDCAITGDYGVTSALIDNIVGGSLGSPFRIIWANGNERGSPNCGTGYASTAPPAGAKNHITVGALNSNNDSITSFSSWGPVDDGRIKPDISAPGCQSNGDGGVTSTWDTGDSDYGTICGTSMAAPTVTGLAALMMEDYTVQFPAQPMFRNSTLKGLLAHSAVDNGNVGPDYQFGYGSVRVQQAIDLMRSAAFLENNVSQGASFTRQVDVTGGDPEFKVTLTWDDVAGTPNVNPALVNDLDLVVTSPSAVRHYPWTLNPGNPSNAAVQSQEDHLNNIEQVLVNSPEAGTWTIEVFGFDVPQGPQSFSLVGDGTLSNGVSIAFPGGLPTTMSPGSPEVIDVDIAAFGETIVPASPTLFYRYSGGAYSSVALSYISGDSYQGVLPAASCGDTPEFYFSAEGSMSGVVLSPSGAPATVQSASVGSDTVVFADDFETDQGWTATNLGASTGDWERGVPVNDPGWDYDPISDSDGSGQSYLTMNSIGNTDIDGGSVRLTSPVIDMSGGEVTISYDYYLYLTVADGVDMLLVEINNNGGSGSWAEIARHDTHGGTTWRPHTITQGDLSAAGVSLTANMVLRFTANDTGTASINESGLDAFQVSAFTCSASATCSDGIQNQGEDRIDCGGPCSACQCTSDPACDNGQFCDGDETCDAFGICVSGTAVNCDDSVGCTNDSCNEGTDSCDNIVNDGNCDDGLYCDGAETCDALLDCQAGTPVDCDDGVGCTDDSCNEGSDSCDNIANDGNCDNGQFCDGAETCDAVQDCQGGSDPCSGQLCDEVGDVCVDCLGDGDCDDGVFCNGAETCFAGACVAGTPIDCDDGIGCTDDSCNEGTDFCDNVVNDANCDNSLYCDGVETCDALLDCQAGTSVDCDDGVSCTDDSCNEGTETCDNVTNDSNCDNDLFCDGAETCDALLDCQAGTPVNCDDGVGCTDDACNEGADSCDHVTNDINCDNGLFCDGAETCDASLDCQSGTPVDCDDGVGCTDDSCNEGSDSCDNLANDGNCDNGLFCDGVETCDALLDCQAGNSIDCDDGVGCTDDTCNEGTDACDNIVNDANCVNGQFCDGAETCDAILDCQSGVDPCPGQSCDEGGDVCVDCLGDGDCDDGAFCNGDETCDAGACVVGTPVDCDDGVGCTDDTCNEGADSCDNIVNDANCDNTQFCDGVETCDVLLDCQAGTPVDCDDGIGCTDDSCNEGNDDCDNIANDAHCDNSLFCDGVETCDALTGCNVSPGSPCGTGTWCAETGDTCQPHGDGDFDGDFDVDLIDFQVFAACFGADADIVPVCSDGNLVGLDGLIDLADYAEVAASLELSGPQ